MEEKTKQQIALEMVDTTTHALIDAITDSVVHLTDDGDKCINIELSYGECSALANLNYEYIAFIEDGKVVFEDKDQGYKFGADDMDIVLLIDVLKALTEGKYHF